MTIVGQVKRERAPHKENEKVSSGALVICLVGEWERGRESEGELEVRKE